MRGDADTPVERSTEPDWGDAGPDDGFLMRKQEEISAREETPISRALDEAGEDGSSRGLVAKAKEKYETMRDYLSCKWSGAGG